MRLMLTVLSIAIPVVAFAQMRAPQIKRTNPPGLSTPTGYTHVVEATGGRTIYVAGQVSLDKDGKVVGEKNMKVQAEQVFGNLQTALAAAGAKFSDVVKMNTYITDVSQAPAVREIRARYFGSTTPASTLVQVAALARPEFMLEIEVIAVLPDPPRVMPARQ